MDPREIKEKATALFSKGKFAKSAEAFEEYCKAAESDVQARLRMGDAWAKAGKKDRAVSAYQRAAEGFAKEGFLPRAIAASKLILELDPAHQGVQKMLADLYARKSVNSRPASGPKGAPAAFVAPVKEAPQAYRSSAAEIELEPEPAPAAAPPSGGVQGTAPEFANRADAIEIEAEPDEAPRPAAAVARAAAPLPPPPPIEVPAWELPPMAPIEIEVDDGADDQVEIDLSSAEVEVPIIEGEAAAAPNRAEAPAAARTEPPAAVRADAPAAVRVDEPTSVRAEGLEAPKSPAAPVRGEALASVRAEATISARAEALDAPKSPAAPVRAEATAAVRAEPPAVSADPPAAVRADTDTAVRAEPPVVSAEPAAAVHANPPAVGAEALDASVRPPRLEAPKPPASAPPGLSPRKSNAPPPAPIRSRPSGTQTELERSLEAFSQIDDVDAPTAPVAASPSLAAFTELELEGDSFLQAVEAAAGTPFASSPSVTLSTEEAMEALDDPKLEPGALPKIPLFSDLPAEAFIALFEKCPLRRAEPGDLLIEQGSQGDSFFVICSGSAKVFRTDDGTRRELAALDEGAFFGEMALLSDSPRTASVEAAAEDTQLLEIPAAVLTELSREHPTIATALKKFCRQRLLSNLMNGATLFKPFTKSERRDLVQKFRARDVIRGETLIREGQRSDGLYVILTGEVGVRVQGTAVATLKEGDVFGEMSLLTRTAATATVETTKKTSLLRLPREDFDAIIMSHPQILELVAELTDARTRKNAELVKKKASAQSLV